MALPEDIIAAHTTVAGRIRALAAAGYSRTEIARLLGKRYQHVRNVLEDDNLRRPPPDPVQSGEPTSGVAEPAQAFDGVIRLTVEADGAIRLPPVAQAVLNARPGGVLIAELGADRLVILNSQAAMARVDRLMAPLRQQGGPLASDELIAERRAEAARETNA